MTTTMICLVSNQPMPNLRPILRDSQDFKVTRVILIVSSEMQKYAKGLEKVLNRHGITVNKHNIDNAYDYVGMSAEFSELINSTKGRILVNITGGTKLMSLALWDAANSNEQTEVIYIRHDNHKGIWLKGSSGEFDINAKMSLDDILDAHNYKQNDPSSFQPNKKQRDFARMLLDEYADKPDIIGLLNTVSYCDTNKKKNISVNFADKKIRKNTLKRLEKILKQAEEAELLKRHEDYLLFPTKNKRKFVCGSWLETAVEDIILEIKQQEENFIEDVKAEVHIRNRNEMDVLVSRSNGLAVIECKTTSYKKELGKREIDVMKQIKEQQDYGGLTTLNILVSINKIENKHALEYAEREGIKIIDGNKLVNLKEHLIRYLNE